MPLHIDDAHGLETSQLKSGTCMRNRALALLTVPAIGTGIQMALYEYDVEGVNINEVDEKDAFSTKGGFAFTTNALL